MGNDETAYVLLGEGFPILWRIVRASDGAECGLERVVETDDGVEVRQPFVRYWTNAAHAQDYLDRLADGTAGKLAPDLPVVWIPPAPQLH